MYILEYGVYKGKMSLWLFGAHYIYATALDKLVPQVTIRIQR